MGRVSDQEWAGPYFKEDASVFARLSGNYKQGEIDVETVLCGKEYATLREVEIYHI
jgi:hypothetical protein